MITICKNCTNSFEGNFCNNCGQTANTHEINFKSIVHEIQHSILHIDKGILYTTKDLFKKPGQTIREYLDGKRVKHFKPFAYVFILSTIYALLTKISHKSTFLTDFLDGFYNGTTDEKSKSDIGLIGDIVLWMSNHYAYSTLLIIPIISFASYLCFFRTKHNYFQHLILNSFVAGQRTVVYLLILPFTYFIVDKEVNGAVDIIKVSLGICLTFWTYYQFFNTTKPIKKILLTILTYLTMIILFVLLVIIIALISKVW
ncbi:MAG: DUF3667 domain-containing protein [Spirosomataceae bacterium]